MCLLLLRPCAVEIAAGGCWAGQSRHGHILVVHGSVSYAEWRCALVASA